MRDPERIDRIIEKLKTVWKKNPDWRLGQLISNLLGAGPRDVFYVEDNDWELFLTNELFNDTED